MPRRPTNRGIQRKDKGIPLTNKQLEHLIFGWTWLDDEFPFESEKDRRQCWERHKDQIVAMMTDDEDSKGLHPYLLVGMRPDAWFEFEGVPARKRWQATPDYLDEHELWFTDEKRKYIAMKEREERACGPLRNVIDLAKFRRVQDECD